MSCRFYPHPELCGHKVCECDYEPTDEELDEIDSLNQQEPNKGDNMKITQINNRYVVDLADGRLHILNRKALIWNLKNVFGVKSTKSVLKQLDTDGEATITLTKVA